MNTDEQLRWEARFGPPAAAAALVAALLQLAALVVQTPAIRDAPSRDEDVRYRESLEHANEFAGTLVTTVIISAAAAALTVAALLYLFEAARYRRPQLRAGLRWVFIAAPVLLLAGPLLIQLNAQDLADQFLASGEQSNARAESLIEDNQSVLGFALFTAGALGLAVGFVMISLQSMRAGLLSRFMGILGVIGGILTVIPLLQFPVVEVFWLAALGLIFLGRWPGGRGPAWETGRDDPWPVPQRGAPRGGPEEPAPSGPGGNGVPPEPEPVPERPRSRKRKRRK